MKILHVVAGLSIRRGGPTRVILGMTKALAEMGSQVTIFAVSDDTETLPSSKMVDVHFYDKNLIARIWPSYSSDLHNALKREASRFDIVHIHEIWHYPHFAAYKAAVLNHIPFVVTIHGSLDSWCLNHKALRKKIYSALFQKNILKRAAGIHAMTENEVEVIARFVDHKKIFCISNGIDPDEFDHLPERSFLETRYPELDGKKVILFLGRLNRIKGLDLLIKAFLEVARMRDDVHLLIAGPDENGYSEEIISLLSSGNILDKVTFTGMLEGEARLGAFSRADIFVLPSYSEGFSMSILEAMTCKLPVIITKGCNFDEVETFDVGLVTDSNAISLRRALVSLLDDSRRCSELGTRGNKLVLAKYTWNNIANQMSNIYREILHSHK